MVSVLSFVYMAHYIYWFTCVKPALHLWDEGHLIMMYAFFFMCFWISLVSVIVALVLYLTLLIWAFYLFFLFKLVQGFSILFILLLKKKKLLWVETWIGFFFFKSNKLKKNLLWLCDLPLENSWSIRRYNSKENRPSLSW